MKFPKLPLPKLSNQTLIEAQIGFYSGMLVGLIGIWFCIVFLMNNGFWFNFFVTISDIFIMGFQLIGLYQAIMQRRQMVEMGGRQKEIEDRILQSLNPIKEAQE